MKLNPYDMGICGVEQCMSAGSISFDTEGASTGVDLCQIPENIIITRAVALVDKAFNAATTNVLTVGTNDDVNDLLGSGKITAGTAGAYSADLFIKSGEEKTIKAKYTSTGTAATAGTAEVFLFFVRTPA